MNDQTVARFIIETVKQNPGIKGCRLGTIVKRAFPWFKGLRGYIEQNCTSEVVVVGTFGQDVGYAHVSSISDASLSAALASAPAITHAFEESPRPQSPAATSATRAVAFPVKPTAIAEPSPQTTFWQAFTNPSFNAQLALNKATSEMKVTVCPTGIESPFIEIPKVTKNEHSTIMKGFLDLLDPADRQYAYQSIGPALSWSRWSTFMWHYGGGKYNSMWLNYRTSTLRKLFEERLITLGVSEPVVPVLVSKLIESKQQRRRFGQERSLDRTSESSGDKNTDSPNESAGVDYMRKLAAAAVAKMDLNELRGLRLPLGAIADALDRNASRT